MGKNTMQNLSFTSEHQFNEMTLFIHHQYFGKKPSLNQIRHNIAEKEGFNSVEAYVIALNKLFIETPLNLYCNETTVLFDPETELITVTTLVSDEDYSDACGSEQRIAYLLFGDEIYTNTFTRYLEINNRTRVVNTTVFDWNGENERENIIDYLAQHQKYNSIQKYIFDEVMKIVNKHISDYGLSDLADFIEDGANSDSFSSYEYDFNEGSQSYFNIDLSHEHIISGLPVSSYQLYENQNNINMDTDENYTSNDIVAQSINDTWNNVAEKLVNKYLEYIFNHYYENDYDADEDTLDCISDIYNVENDKIISKLFAEYITA
jgi:hypothetical protein